VADASDTLRSLVYAPAVGENVTGSTVPPGMFTE
jgi:hypothetical protein